MSESINDIIQKLDNSPMFHMSLSDKELFHSNFIYWLCRKYPEEMTEVFKDYVKDTTGELVIDPKEVRREEDHIDLKIGFKNGQELIIENKVKSFPDLHQLEKYSDNKKSNDSYLLLSLYKPFYAKNGEFELSNGKVWKYLSYTELANLLRKNILSCLEKSSYEYNLIEDYLNYIVNFSEINEFYENNISVPFNFEELKKNPENIVLKEYRLWDHYQRNLYAFITYKISEKLFEIYPKYQSKFSHKKLKDISIKNIEDEIPFVRIYFGYMKNPFLGVQFVNNSNYNLGISIQGYQYRHYISKLSWPKQKSKKDIEKKLIINKAKELLDAGWFDLPAKLESENGTNMRKEFGHYSDSGFTYKYINLGIASFELIIEQIVEDMVKSIKFANENKEILNS